MNRLIFILFFASLMPLQAQRVDPEKAERVAQRYVETKRGQHGKPNVRLEHTARGRHDQRPDRQHRSVRDLDPNRVESEPQDTLYYYVFNIEQNDGGGFVIVAADEKVRPVLGYSSNGHYDPNNLPPNFVYWMNFLQCVLIAH